MDSPNSTSEANPIIPISPNGNVVLVVGPKAVRLRVHSLLLQSASKVFNAMFGPNWSEGQGLSEESRRSICLEEDDPEALRIICCVIHHRNDVVSLTLPPKQVLQIAIAADKYDLAVALTFAASQWLRQSQTFDMVEMGISSLRLSYSAIWTVLPDIHWSLSQSTQLLTVTYWMTREYVKPCRQKCSVVLLHSLHHTPSSDWPGHDRRKTRGHEEKGEHLS